MEAAQPLLLYRRISTIAARRMLSSPLTSRNPCSNLNRESEINNPNSNRRLLNCCSMKPSDTESSAYTKTPISTPKIDSSFLKFPQSLNPVNNCFSVTPAVNSVLISSQSPTEVENCEAAAGVVSPQSTLVVVSFYKFADFPDHADFRKPLKELCEKLRVSGGIILAPEGINGSICGIRNSVEQVLAFIENDNRLRGLRLVESPVSPEEEAIHHGHTSSSPLAAGEDAPFRWDHVRVKLKKEIVTLGMPSVSPIERVGKYVSPRDWNILITDPNVVVIDVRNDYETRIGKFKGAVDPSTTAFRDFPSWVDNEFKLGKLEESACSAEVVDTEEKKERMLPRVAMYCTGGIRCEKASSFLLSKGFKEVYHLQGGILKYLEEVPETESLWEGECFVFDKRVSVEHGLVPGTFKLCYGCKKPVGDADMEAPEWEYGVSCPYCFETKSEEEKERARARQRQFKRWGIIGGPDKGRKPVKTVDDSKNLSTKEESS